MAQNVKTIRFSLVENKLAGKQTSPYTARVRGYKTVGQEEIISIMAGKNASVSRQEILVVLDLLKSVIADILLAGDRVSTDLFHARLSIRGAFESPDADYTPGNHSVRVRMTPDVFLKKQVAQKARMEKIRARKPVPELDSVYDYASLAKNSRVTCGHTAELKGVNLDCDQQDKAQGVFFKDKETGAELKAKVVHKQTATAIVFQVPELVAGTYSLILRRAFGNEIRQGRLEAEISVN